MRARRDKKGLFIAKRLNFTQNKPSFNKNNGDSLAKLYLPNHYIQQIADQLQLLGVDRDAWLAASGVAANLIDDRQAMLTFDQFKALIIQAIRLSDEPALGLLVGNSLQISSHGMLGYAVSASRCLRETLELFSRYLSTRTPLIRVENQNLGAEVRLELHPCYDFQAIAIPFYESALFTLYNLIQQISAPHSVAANPRGVISRLCFPYREPHYAERYQQYFDCPIEFNQPFASLCLDSSYLDQPLKSGDEATLLRARAICEEELQKYQALESYAARIRKYLLACEVEFPSIRQMANLLHLSSRSLNRRLMQENTRFSAILADTRAYRAKQWLLYSDQTIQAIAYRLGYSDPANFRKAFKLWTGVSPRDYRKNQQIKELPQG